MTRSAYALLLLMLVLTPLFAACSNPFAPRTAPVGGISEPPPQPNSAINVIRVFEWCWDNRDPTLLRDIFTADYTFVFGFADSAGNPYRNRPFSREDELESANNLFVRGNGSEPPANSISLDFDQSMIALPDSRRGKNGKWHKEIATSTLLRIDTDATDFDVQGFTRFFVVRGDSVLLPQELIDRKFKQDSTRWYIEQIQDETLGEVAARVRATAMPSRALTWGFIRALYREPQLRSARPSP
jgi:hypothetical protein